MILVYGLSIIYLLFMVVLLILGLFVNVKATTKQLYFLFILSALSLGFIAYGTFPNEGSDLSRYYIEIENMRHRGLEYVFNDFLYKNTILTNVFFYLISLTNNNHLLPFFSTILTFSIFSYVVIKVTKRYNIKISVLSIFILSFLAIIFLRPILTGVRQHLALSIMLLAVFKDFNENKRDFKTILLYILPLLIHTGTIPIIIIRILYLFKGKFYKIRYLLLGWTFLIPFLSIIFLNTNNYLSETFEKLLGYQYSDYPDMRLFIILILILLLILYLVKTVSKEKKNLQDFKLEDYTKFYILLLIFTVGCIDIHHLFSRMLSFCIYMLLPILFLFYKNDRKTKTIVTFLFLFLIFGLLLYQIIDAKTSWRLII